MKVKDYLYDKDRKIATLWLEDIDKNELKQILTFLEFENERTKEPQISEDDQAVLDAI